MRRRGQVAIANSGKEEYELALNRPVSMNMWGFTPDFLDELEKGFFTFLDNLTNDQLKAEYLLPSAVDNLIKKRIGRSNSIRKFGPLVWSDL